MECNIQWFGHLQADYISVQIKIASLCVLNILSGSCSVYLQELSDVWEFYRFLNPLSDFGATGRQASAGLHGHRAASEAWLPAKLLVLHGRGRLQLLASASTSSASVSTENIQRWFTIGLPGRFQDKETGVHHGIMYIMYMCIYIYIYTHKQGMLLTWLLVYHGSSILVRGTRGNHSLGSLSLVPGWTGQVREAGDSAINPRTAEWIAAMEEPWQFVTIVQ